MKKSIRCKISKTAESRAKVVSLVRLAKQQELHWVVLSEVKSAAASVVNLVMLRTGKMDKDL